LKRYFGEKAGGPCGPPGVARLSPRADYWLGWFLLISALHFFFLTACDAIVRGAMADRVVAVVVWKMIYVCARGLITGWLLASWVCLFRQCETARANQETWIRY
jgi:hypothetical protein